MALIHGKDPSGNSNPVSVSADGRLATSMAGFDGIVVDT